jgi:hypothetical protein
MRKLVREAGVFLLLIMPTMAVAADEYAYRIAGIIASGANGWQTIVEPPDGEQKVVSEGDYLGQIKIVSISKEGVVLQFPDGNKQMRLKQGGFVPLPENVVAGSSADTVTSTTTGAVKVQRSYNVNKQAQPYVGGRGSLSNHDTGSSVSDGTTGSSGGSASSASDGTTGSPGVSAVEFVKRVEKQLTSDQVASVRGLESLDELSESARIVSYSDVADSEAKTPIESVDTGVNMLQQSIIEGKELRISVDGDANIMDIYVIPK